MRSLKRLLPLALCLTLLLALAAAQEPDRAGLEHFEKRVRPLLAAKCYSCHSATSKPVMGGLRLDTRQGLLQGGGHGPAIVPGDPEKSLLIRAVRFEEGAPKMPPAGKLSRAEIEALEEWVRAGAPDPRQGGPASQPKPLAPEKARERWPYRPLRPVALPSSAARPLPVHPVDRFVAARLAARGLTFNPVADRRTLIRRASLDLLGLPPSPEEVRAFLNDRAPGAWDRLLDRLLASPHYGERWGRHWLDVARWAESHGYEQDYDRPYAYHYRDFVIKALNADMPFDQFARWQIAGDELAPEEPLAWMATGFLGAGTHATQITKSQVEKERYDELDDMGAVTSTAFLGLTLGCARCHDHKYDPISIREYYRLVSTFTTSVRSDYEVDLDPSGYRAELAKWERDQAPLDADRDQYERTEVARGLEAWLQNPASRPLPPQWVLPEVLKAHSEGGAAFEPQPDGSLLVTGTNAEHDLYTLTLRPPPGPLRALRVEALTHPTLVKGGPGRAANGNFALTDLSAAIRDAEGRETAVPLAMPRATFEQKGLPAAAVLDADPASGWAVDPEFGKDHALAVAFAEPRGLTAEHHLVVRLRFAGNTGHNIGRVRLSVSADAERDLREAGRPAVVDRVALQGASGLTPAERAAIAAWFRTTDAGWREREERAASHRARRPLPRTVKAMIVSEGVPAIRTHTQGGDYLEETHYLRRGDPNLKEGVAEQGFLTVLMRTPEGEKRWIKPPPEAARTPHRRSALAAWLTDVEHGAGSLLARVAANRVWHYHFGRGIVATPSDFGAQGERPTHPELLEWLANRLVADGWRLKSLHRLIMTSRTYMQSSRSNPMGEKLDPENRLLWRYNRRRLEAEALRDSLLAVSGELDRTLYGPGSLDEEMKRRSIYFFVKRSRLVPAMVLFDAPNALQPIASRPTTTVSPQALMLLNSPVVRKVAQAFAQRIAGPNAVAAAFQRAFGRDPTEQERQASERFLAAQRAAYAAEGRRDAEAAALADFCQALFGLNEFAFIE
jgi:hypothetical protein